MTEHDHHREEDFAEVLKTTQVAYENVRWLYHSNFYDGPLSGRVIVKQSEDDWSSEAEVFWVEMFEECDEYDAEDEFICGFYRRYKLIKLTPEADAEEARRHKLFEDMVGTHTNYVYDEHGNRCRASLFDSSGKPSWHDYYALQKKWPEWKPEGEVIGWFQYG